MKYPNEIFTFPIDNQSEIAKQTIQNHNCRYTGKKCGKMSRLINYPMGVCSVNYNEHKPIICPDRFLEDNIKADDISKINGPIGLPINAQTPSEIAVSIMAEIISSLRNQEYTIKELRGNWKNR